MRLDFFIHYNCQVLFSMKKNEKHIYECSAAVVIGALRVKSVLLSKATVPFPGAKVHKLEESLNFKLKNSSANKSL